jgi:L-arabinose isomerase
MSTRYVFILNLQTAKKLPPLSFDTDSIMSVFDAAGSREGESVVKRKKEERRMPAGH